MKRKLLAMLLAAVMICSSLTGLSVSAGSVSLSNIQSVMEQIDALDPQAADADALSAIEAAQAAYDALSEEEQLFVTNAGKLNAAYSGYYNALADQNNGTFVSMDFEDGTAADAANRVTATMGSSTSIVSDGHNGEKSVSITNSNSMNSMVGWKADDYDPFLYSENGATISMWVNFSALSNNTPIFTSGHWGYRFYLGYDSGSFKVSARNYDSTTSEFTISDIADLTTAGWTLLTVSCDADKNYKFYCNGTLVASQTLSFSLYDIASYARTASNLSTTNVAYMNYYSIGCATYWNDRTNPTALVDDFSIYNSALNAQEVAKLYDPDIQPDTAAVNAVIDQINALDLSAYSAAALSAVDAAQSAYDALSAFDKTYVTNYSILENADSTLYNNSADANGGKFVSMDFEDGTAADSAGRVTASMGSSTSVVSDGKYGQKSVSIANSNSINSMVGWKADNYDPLLYSEDGATISMWVNISSLSTNTPIFSYGHWGYRFYLGYDSGSFKVSARNYDSTTSEFTISDIADLTTAGWALLTVNCDADKNYKFYCNGTLVASQTLSFSLYDIASYARTASNLSTTNVAYMNYYSIGCATYWNDRTNPTALVDDFSIYNSALSAAQIAQLYTQSGTYDAGKVQNVITLIDAIPDSGDTGFLTALKTAEDAYAALNEYEQLDVTNIDTMNAAAAQRDEQYPAVLYRFEGQDIKNCIVEDGKVKLLVNAGVSLSEVHASAVLADGCTFSGADAAVWDLSAPFDITVASDSGANTTYTVEAYSISDAKAADSAKAYAADKLCKNLPVYLYRSGMADAQAAVAAYEALTDVQRLLMTYADKASSAAARMTELENSPVRITCVGSSTCYGTGSTNAATDSYPAQMGALLGNGYEVTNVGVPGTTVVSTASVGIYSYMGTSEYTRGLQSEPDIVMMFVGSNDTDSSRWNSAGYKAQFIKDYTTMLESYLNLDSHPQVILTYPYQSYSGDRATYIPEVMSMIDVIAEQYGCGVLDLYTVTNEMLNASDWSTYFNSDKLHPTTVGYTKIAQVAYDYLEDEFAQIDTFDVQDIKIGGTALEGFDADTDSYTVSYRGATLPEITADVGGDSTVKIVQPTAANPVGFVYVESDRFQYGRAYQIIFDSISQQELTAQAALAQTALSGLTVNNSTTAQSILESVKSALTSTYASAAWASDPTITAATREAAGSIVGTLVVSVDGLEQEIAVSLTIPQSTYVLGDVDNDGQVTVSDVVELRGIIMAGDPTEQQLAAGDLNEDGILTVSDVVDLRDYIMRGAAG